MDTYNLNDDVVKMMEEYFDIEYDNETKRFTTEDMLNFTIHAVIKLNKPAVRHIVCPTCGCNKLQHEGNNHYLCLNVLCNFQGQIMP